MNVWGFEFDHKTFPNPGVSAVNLCAWCVKPVQSGEQAEVRITHEHLSLKCTVVCLIKRHDYMGVELNNTDEISPCYLYDSVHKYLRCMSDWAREWIYFGWRGVWRNITNMSKCCHLSPQIKQQSMCNALSWMTKKLCNNKDKLQWSFIHPHISPVFVALETQEISLKYWSSSGSDTDHMRLK